MMVEAGARGHAVWACEPHDIQWQRHERVRARMHLLQLHPGQAHWHSVVRSAEAPLAEMGAVIMRKDPPVDTEYLYATHLLTQAEREGARVFNRPQALREHSEKLAIMEFQPFIADTLVTRKADDIRAFHARHRDIILKPLDGMGGMGIFRVGPDGLNLGSITETLTHYGQRSVMAQVYLPAIAQGDKRILLINGHPLPYALARIPQGNDIRGNLAAGGRGVVQPLSPRDREIAEALGPTLAARGLLLVGLDVIGEHLTEINVTSPTCFQEIAAQSDCPVAAVFLDALEAAVAHPPARAAGPSGDEPVPPARP
jgi:glutathione synthase